MKNYDLAFCFKGSRNYVHGTDVYNQLIDLIKDERTKGMFDLSFHGLAQKNITLSEKKPENSLLKFVCIYKDIENEKKVLYGADNGTSINCSYEYLEEHIIKASQFNLQLQQVILKKRTKFTFIENAVTLNKHLLQSLFPEQRGKWYFTRLQLMDTPEIEVYPLKLVLKANFNFKLTKTEIFIGSQSIGFIYFSLV